jgi:endonuclease/exonuclease/phosphatase family metal-dependent hydrolase
MVAAATLFGACSDAGVSSPEFEHASPMQGGISVLSWNVYVGTDVDAVINALADGFQEADLAVLSAQVETLVMTDFPSRSAAIVDEIADRRPHVVGLQEITTLHLEAFGIPTIDFLEILQRMLAARGLNYVVAGQILNIDVSIEVPQIGVIGMQDYDVMLVDAKRVKLNEAWGKSFEYNIGPVAEGIDLKRGYVYADVRIGGKDYSVVTTHLESSGPPDVLPDLRGAQAMEIATVLAGAERAVVMGDLNDEGSSPMNSVFAGAGFLDVWPTLHPGTDGFTCCHALTLDEKVPEFYQRIDYIFARGLEHPVQGLHGSIEILGEDPADRILDAPYYPLWPSDHAGLAGEFFVPVATGLR